MRQDLSARLLVAWRTANSYLLGDNSGLWAITDAVSRAGPFSSPDPRGTHDGRTAQHQLEPRQLGGVMSFGEATYWHNHPDLPRLAQNMREQMEQQSTAFN